MAPEKAHPSAETLHGIGRAVVGLATALGAKGGKRDLASVFVADEALWRLLAEVEPADPLEGVPHEGKLRKAKANWARALELKPQAPRPPTAKTLSGWSSKANDALAHVRSVAVRIHQAILAFDPDDPVKQWSWPGLSEVRLLARSGHALCTAAGKAMGRDRRIPPPEPPLLPDSGSFCVPLDLWERLGHSIEALRQVEDPALPSEVRQAIVETAEGTCQNVCTEVPVSGKPDPWRHRTEDCSVPIIKAHGELLDLQKLLTVEHRGLTDPQLRPETYPGLLPTTREAIRNLVDTVAELCKWFVMATGIPELVEDVQGDGAEPDDSDKYLPAVMITRVFGFETHKKLTVFLKNHPCVKTCRPLTRAGKPHSRRLSVHVLDFLQAVQSDDRIVSDPVRLQRIKNRLRQSEINKQLEEACMQMLSSK